MSTRRRPIAILITLSLLALASCKGDNPAIPANPFSPAPLSMASIWPHADGNAWQYTITYTDRLAPTPVKSAAPFETEIPSMDELHALLQIPLPGTPTLSASGTYGLALDGMVTTDSGVTAQRVEKTLDLELDPPAVLKSISVSDSPDDFLRAVARARPDLRSKIMAAKDWSDHDIDSLAAPFFIGGYAFAYEDSGYYGYGDLDQNHSWVYLAESLRVGTSFKLQLIPAISTGIWLTGRIWSQGDLQVGDKIYRNVIECMYVIDLGVNIGTDENGDVIATNHAYVYAVTHFAPNVGPIRGQERWLVPPSSFLQDPGPQRLTEYYLELSSASLND